MYIYIYRQIHTSIDKWMGGWMDGWIDRSVDRSIDRSIDRQNRTVPFFRSNPKPATALGGGGGPIGVRYGGPGIRCDFAHGCRGKQRDANERWLGGGWAVGRRHMGRGSEKDRRKRRAGWRSTVR